jgi:hypothetical protein
MPPVNLGLHFDGIGSLPRLKLRPQIARKMLLEAHKWTSEACEGESENGRVFAAEKRALGRGR